MFLSLTLLACVVPVETGDDLRAASDSGIARAEDGDADPDGDTDTDVPGGADSAVDTGTELDTDTGTGIDSTDAGGSCPAWWLDRDRDGFGAGSSVHACEAPIGRVSVEGDCDDADAAVFPAATEVCDGIDQDCDGVVDDDAADATLWYADRDGDGAGDAEAGIAACDAIGVGLAGDCDDGDPDIAPHVTEVCDDGIDQDCDGRDRACLWTGSLDITAADAAYTGDTTNLDVGEKLADGGDLDGDGYSELLVAAAGTSTGGRSSGAGSVWILHGGAALLGDASVGALAELTFAGCLDDVSAAGDVDGDGFGDALIGQSCAGSGQGAAHLLYGGVARWPSDTAASGDVVFEGTTAEGALGEAVGAAGDVDGDGLDDLLLADATSVYLGYGEPSRWGASVADTSLARWTGEASPTPGGRSEGISSGDLDGDGLADLLAYEQEGRSTGSDVPGEIHVLYGDTARHTGSARLSGWDASFVGPARTGWVGLGRITLAGDLDGDGYDEAIAGSSAHESSRGTVWVFSGDAVRYAGDVPDTAADHVFQGAAPFAYFASSLALVPDLDGYDGAELLVGARGYGAWLFRGGARAGTYDTTAAEASFGGAPYVDDLGEAVAAPDLDGDAIPELLVGAPDAADGNGAIYLFLGASM
ncbi:MAG: MopE-related protein [Pseudomonadota bacterium]|nr:MopE-related protein [Pseudomonadota bacterium]